MGLRGCVKSLRLVPRSEQDRARLQRTRKVPVSLVQLADSIRTSFWPRYLGSGHKRLCMAKMVPQALGALHRNSADSVRHALATGITMRATNIISIAMTLLISTSAFADSACEKKRKLAMIFSHAHTSIRTKCLPTPEKFIKTSESWQREKSKLRSTKISGYGMRS